MGDCKWIVIWVTIDSSLRLQQTDHTDGQLWLLWAMPTSGPVVSMVLPNSACSSEGYSEMLDPKFALGF